MSPATFCISRWHRTPTGETWLPVKRGLSRERAEALVAAAKWDTRTALLKFRVEEER